MEPLGLTTPLERSGVVPKHALEVLINNKIRTVEDLVYYLPIRYEDWRNVVSPSQAIMGKYAVVRGTIADIHTQTTPRKKMKIVRISLKDDAGSLTLVFFNQLYLMKKYRSGDEVVACGTVERDKEQWMTLGMTNPVILSLKEAEKRGWLGRVVPVYQKIDKLTSYRLEMIMRMTLARLDIGRDPVPQFLRSRYKFPGRKEALLAVHGFNSNPSMDVQNPITDPAYQRLIYEDLFLLQLGLAFRRYLYGERVKGIAFSIDEKLRVEIEQFVPFSLTRTQKKVMHEIFTDMQNPWPMQRLLQGDVGSGKTIVAACAMRVAIENGYQSVLMAPTELLAEQHAYTLKKLFQPTGYVVGLLTGSMGRVERSRVLEEIQTGEIPIIVGTHALFQKGVVYHNLGLVVIDEQHRFGVRHRALIREKGHRPDTLVLTATPIPRSLALTLYGDLDTSVLDEMPPGRRPIQTRHATLAHRERIYRWLATQLDQGGQAYIVCPLIEESEKLQVRAATKLYEELQGGWLKGYRLGLVHGQIRREEREKIMDAFQRGELDALVATTVIEVGVDNPRATVMIVEHAERFGLAQLHQLRGRVGRGEAPSYCILITSPEIGEDARLRLKTLVEVSSGFEIAEVDMRLRGPGQLAGTRQSGVSRLKVADFVRDARWIPRVHHDAMEYAQKWFEKKGQEGEKEALRFLREWVRRYGLIQVG